MTRRALIMAGGQGMRLQPLTVRLPKPLVPVANRPVIDYILELLSQHGFTTITMTLHYRAESIIDYVGDGARYGLQITHVVEEQPLGTAGSVKQAVGDLDEPLLIISGDCLTDFNLSSFARRHAQSGALASLALTRVERPVEYGIVITDAAGDILDFLEKPSWSEVFSDTINTGIYLLNPGAVAAIPPGICDFSRDLFPALLAQGERLSSQVMPGYWCDIGDLTQYREAQRAALDGDVALGRVGKEIAPGLWVGDDCVIQGEVQAPAILGRGVVVGRGARVEGGSALGDGVVIGAGSRITRSVLWSGSQVGDRADLLEVVLCEGAQVATGAMLCPGVVLGNRAYAGASSRISTGLKVAPDQVVSPEWRLERHLNHAVRFPGPLFYPGRVEGEFNRELLVEDACRIGRALAAQARAALVSSNGEADALTLAAGLSAGIRSRGANVLYLGSTLEPVTRFAVRQLEVSRAVHVESQAGKVCLRLFDGEGEALGSAEQRRLEAAVDRESTGPRRAGCEKVQEVTSAYVGWLVDQLPRERLRSYQLGLQALSPASRYLGSCLAAVTGWQLDAGPAVLQLGGAGARSLTFAGGQVLSDETLDELVVALLLAQGERRLVVSSRLALGLENFVRERGGELIPRSGRTPGVAQGGIQLHGVSLPAQVFWQDQLLRWLYCLSYLGTEWAPWETFLAQLPNWSRVERQLQVPQNLTGRVMRALVASHHRQGLELREGLQIRAAQGWVWGRPDGQLPIYHIEAGAFSQEAASELAVQVEEEIKALLGRNDPG